MSCIPVPLTANASLTSTAVYEITVPATATYAVNQVRTSVVDGYGTLLLPDGTSHEVLRLKSIVVSEDSVYVNAADQGFAFVRETVTYAWMGEGGMPWMEVVTNLGIPTVVRYQGSPRRGCQRLGCFQCGDERFSSPQPNANRVKRSLCRGVARIVVCPFFGRQEVMSFEGGTFSTHGLTPALYVVRNDDTGATRRLLIQ